MKKGREISHVEHVFHYKCDQCENPMLKGIHTCGKDGPRYQKTPVYTLGSPDPRAFISPSGLDVKCYFQLSDGTVECIPTVQAVSWDEQHGVVYGEITAIVYDEDEVAKYKKTIRHIVLKASTAEDSVSKMHILDVRFVGSRSNVTIEDMIMEVHTFFEAGEIIPWKKMNEHTS